MTNLKVIAVSSVAIVAALAGCSSGEEVHRNSTHDNISMSGGQYATPGYAPSNYQNTSKTMANADYDPSGNYMRDSSVGPILTTPGGMTVYTFDRDSPNASNCDNTCATIWQPVIAPSNAQPFGQMTIVARTDGTRQWAYGGKPLYLYANDHAPGDVTGNGQGGMWHVVQ